MSAITQANCRTPAGHPEGYLEAFANIYQHFGQQIRARLVNENADSIAQDVPGIEEAIRGMAFIENVVAASQSTQKWHDFTTSSSNVNLTTAAMTKIGEH
jgi:hypothetical protein